MPEYGKLSEFPTFRHDKQTTIVFLLSLLECKLNKGLRKTVNSTQDYSSKSVNFFQDDTVFLLDPRYASY